MSKHHPDVILCRKLPGIAIGRLCEKCDGKCPICDSYDAYYCAECTQLEKDRDGCPKTANLGTSRLDSAFNRKKQRAFQRG
ncbi:Pre-mRNA-splicing factor ini1 [Malassezia sp. CBS 17886]|nr:Pre-mRNA-splicing factor ini1 [Malassezia sp. CBS 17886]